MIDSTEQALTRKINDFLCRKAAEFPELHLDVKWDAYQYVPRPKRYDYNRRKHALAK